MLSKPRKTYPHEILALLQKRKKLTPSDEVRLYRLEKGHEGEQEFAKVLLKELQQPYITLYGIMLEHNESHFQIDCMIISQGTIYLIDIKYFSREYYYHNDDFYLIKTKEKIDNPLHQLERCEGLLHKLLKKNNFHYKIESHVLFLHPEFTLFAAPINEKVMLRSQVPRFIRKLNQQPMHITAAEQRLQKFIRGQHRETTIYDNMRAPEFNQLSKGIFCLQSTGELGVYRGNGRVGVQLQCMRCRKTELAESALLRAVIEYHMLFPDERITTTSVYEWCAGVVTKKVIRRTIKNHLTEQGKGRGIHYIFKENHR